MNKQPHWIINSPTPEAFKTRLKRSLASQKKATSAISQRGYFHDETDTNNGYEMTSTSVFNYRYWIVSSPESMVHWQVGRPRDAIGRQTDRWTGLRDEFNNVRSGSYAGR
ncbi:hypothetical protein J6590_019586 [Homalodisca vitripennis]|nr:hypothetical protein J6590_019586 [Homalodisca vitripennis]